MMIARCSIFLVLISLILAGSVVAAPADVGAIQRSREALSAGVTTSSENGVQIRATLGQPFVGTLVTEDVSLQQGYWHSQEPGYRLYLPLVLKY
jgi:hypothetical protein